MLRASKHFKPHFRVALAPHCHFVILATSSHFFAGGVVIFLLLNGRIRCDLKTAWPWLSFKHHYLGTWLSNTLRVLSLIQILLLDSAHLNAVVQFLSLSLEGFTAILTHRTSRSLAST